MNSETKHVAEKVLHRAEISRITRTLKSRLALASFKQERGWQDLDLKAIEPKVAKEQKQLEKISKKKNSSSKKNRKSNSTAQAVRKKRRSGMIEIPESITQFAFAPQTPKRQYQLSSSTTSSPYSYYNMNSSPPTMATPHTPPPRARHGSQGGDRKEGADLLMYLATSPSPATSASKSGSTFRNNMAYMSSSPPLFTSPSTNQTQFQLPYTNTTANSSNANAPKTPKSNGRSSSNYVSSSVVNTPQGFNPNDYLNITSPSPSASANGKKVRVVGSSPASKLFFPSTPEQKIHLPPPPQFAAANRL